MTDSIDVTAVQLDEELETLVGQIWTDVIGCINDVVAGSRLGFSNFQAYADPSIDDIVKSITLIDNYLNTMLDGSIGVLTHYSETRLANCQHCVHLIRRVHLSLKHNNPTEFEDVVHKLKSHSGFN